MAAIALEGKLGQPDVAPRTFAGGTILLGARREADRHLRHWFGLVDDVRLFNYALPEEEIRAEFVGDRGVR